MNSGRMTIEIARTTEQLLCYMAMATISNDANKRTAQAVVEELMRRNGVTSGVTSGQMRKVIQRVATGELREINDIARALRGF